MSGAAIPILSSIAPIAADSEAWVVDVWGVIHNGVRAFPAATDACRRFRSRGGTVLLVSNAPRPSTAVVPQLEALGVASDAYDLVVTSGDVTRALLAGWQGRRLLHIGPERDKGLFESLDAAWSDAETAELIVCSGLFDDTKETPDDYTRVFELLLARDVPMICANPDLMVERGDQLVYCAGALAALYASSRGRVTYAGKPHPPIYQRTLAEIERIKGRPVTKEKVLAIGDGIETDIRGAHEAGLRSVFIASAVHCPDGLTPALLVELFSKRPFAPIAALPALMW
jgi:HAD superfamily hydrolase (TIGR01459 family)